MNAIIFLAPISCFDEHLAEDPSINRLEDTFILWKAICSSKQLCHTTLVVFMNKCDLLEKKIRKGVSVKKYLPSYGERSNDAAVFTKCGGFSLSLTPCFSTFCFVFNFGRGLTPPLA